MQMPLTAKQCDQYILGCRRGWDVSLACSEVIPLAFDMLIINPMDCAENFARTDTSVALIPRLVVLPPGTRLSVYLQS